MSNLSIPELTGVAQNLYEAITGKSAMEASIDDMLKTCEAVVTLVWNLNLFDDADTRLADEFEKEPPTPAGPLEFFAGKAKKRDPFDIDFDYSMLNDIAFDFGDD